MKAKQAWLCYTTVDYDEPFEIVIKFKEPTIWSYDKVVPIVYFELE